MIQIKLRHILFPIFICTILFTILGCRKAEEHPETMAINNNSDLKAAQSILNKNPYDQNTWESICTYYTEQRYFTQLIQMAEPFYERMDTADTQLRTLLAIYLAQAYLFHEDFDKANQYILELEDKDIPLKPRFSICYHNIHAILSIKKSLDYSQALYHLKAAMDIAKSEGLKLNYCSLLCNIAMIYYNREDLSGMSYAEEAYQVSQELDNQYASCYSQILMAQMLNLAEDPEEALKYAEEAQIRTEAMDSNLYEVPLKILYGDICLKRREYHRAEAYYMEAHSAAQTREPALSIEILVHTGQLHLTTGNYLEAARCFREALGISYATNNLEKRHKILLGLSDTYSHSGNKEKALEYYKAYHHFSDSISLIQKERDFHRLLMNYDRMEYESLLHKNELYIQKSQRENIIICFILLCICIILGWVWSLYQKKNQMYQQLAEQHNTYQQRTRKLAEAVEDARSKDERAEKKDAQLFENIEKTVSELKLYREKDICVEKLAETMNTNRSYISRSINHYAGMSFTNYINLKRIDEATAILSNPDNTTPIKVIADELGFNSISSFSRVFQRETGCPPSKYKEYIQNKK